MPRRNQSAAAKKAWVTRRRGGKGGGKDLAAKRKASLAKSAKRKNKNKTGAQMYAERRALGLPGGANAQAAANSKAFRRAMNKKYGPAKKYKSPKKRTRAKK